MNANKDGSQKKMCRFSGPIEKDVKIDLIKYYVEIINDSC